jgi:uncharacterized protein (DUF983 family)
LYKGDRINTYVEWMLSFTNRNKICPDCGEASKFKYFIFENYAVCKECGVIVYEREH